MRTLRFLAVVMVGAAGIIWVSMAMGETASRAGAYAGVYLGSLAAWWLTRLWRR